MKAIYLFICQLFVLSTVMMAQPSRVEIKTLKDYQLKGPVKKVLDTTGLAQKFTQEGYLQFNGFSEEGKLTGTTYTYDKVGHLLKKESLDNASVYTYNARGQMIKEQILSGTKCISSTSYLYDMNGHVRQEILKSGVVSSFKNTYDTQKRLVKIEHVLLPSNSLLNTTDITYLPNGWTRYVLRERTTQIIKEYDNKGRERSNIMHDSSSNQNTKSARNYDDNDNLIEYQGLFSTTLYTYNDQGELTAKEEIGSLSTIKTKYIYTKYDPVGNWVERIADNDGEQNIETRTIEYFE